VSYYALFKGVAASKPTSRLSRHEHILRYTQRPLRGLSCGSGFFPSRRRTLSLGDCLPGSIGQVFGVWLGLVGRSGPRAHPVALPPADTSRGPTSIDFGENQLSPGLIGLSPLPTGHPNGFQPVPVRASTGRYPRFTLPMGRSPWFRVCAHELQLALVTGLAFAPAPLATSLASLVSSNSPDHNAKGTQSVATRTSPRPTSYRLWACGFRSSFTPRPGVLFTCPSRYSFTIGHTGVFSLGGWSPQLHARFLVPGVTQELRYVRPLAFAYRALTVSGAPFQGTSARFACRVRGSYNPAPVKRTVWAPPVSLAATRGISLDFSSSGY
jgi:hypothetical protein